MTAAVVIEALGDCGLLVRLGDAIDPALNGRVHALAARLEATAPPWVTDIVPAYASLAVLIDPNALDSPARQDSAALEQAERWLREALSADAPTLDDAASLAACEIPVCYGGEFGPDLQSLAEQTGLSIDQVIAKHSAAEYRVGLIGFAPGFPYLLGMDPALALPRLATPRTRVPAGSVGIGGAQTGIYPRESPGGWRLIGRTP
ncbi:MAG: hypothetical protein CVV17_12600, partial [Gammaproteobacteria bacterium HGW-Gammaproteobacteria-7]